ncbi:hypothetical protein [Clostridium sp. HBUAS56010]|uniref:hypothetical protein n=1 Tax=Clostridium sp. HBUAS56010 TaxID=2571127 RepID=UPI0011776DB4|nr:hypothetical protein [Clostridium sp. HBUAS56010]
MFLSTITAYFIIPVYTILFAWGTNWFTMNFSVLGNLPSRKNFFLLWGIIVGAYFYYILKQIIFILPRNKKEKALSLLSIFFLAFGVLTPYLPDSQPFSSVLHVMLSFMASISLLICLYMIMWKLYCMNKTAYRSYLICLSGITVLSAFLLILSGIVSTALEIFFVLSCNMLLHKLYNKLYSPKLIY